MLSHSWNVGEFLFILHNLKNGRELLEIFKAKSTKGHHGHVVVPTIVRGAYHGQSVVATTSRGTLGFGNFE